MSPICLKICLKICLMPAHLKTPSSWNLLSSTSPKVWKSGSCFSSHHFIPCTFPSYYLPRIRKEEDMLWLL